MKCPECGSTSIDFFLSSTEMIRLYQSKGKTGLQLNKIFNPVNQKPYTIKCGRCHGILKEVGK